MNEEIKKDEDSKPEEVKEEAPKKDVVEEKPEKAIIFYCKVCKEIADVTREGKKYVFKCKACGKKDVAFGTPKGIKDFYHLK